jgi:16S rRNA (cytosine1402-N4)-methyltransferase
MGRQRKGGASQDRPLLSNSSEEIHRPVLLTEVVRWLQPERGGLFIDCTLGLGGHSEAILDASAESQVLAIDRDPEALELARGRLARFGDRARLVHANFGDLQEVASRFAINPARGILADLGVSSLQLDRSERGFSFDEAPLDMRMDPGQRQTAAALINSLSEPELADLIFEYGEERHSRKIARWIVRERATRPIETTRQLADLVVRALKVPGRWRIHPATRTFQALRIAVNQELVSLRRLIPAAIDVLGDAGRLAVISFHSLEDRIVKRGFQRESGRCICEVKPPISGMRPGAAQAGSDPRVVCENCGALRRVEILTRKPIRPSEEEVAGNPRSRSALLRVCQKI